MAVSSIIDEKYLPMIETAIADLQRAGKELELARRAGVFTGENKVVLDDLAAKVQSNLTALTTLKSVYFANA